MASHAVNRSEHIFLSPGFARPRLEPSEAMAMEYRSLLSLVLGPLLIAATASGCKRGGGDEDPGQDSDGPGDSGGDEGPGEAFECDPTLASEALPLRRLSKIQYDNTVRDLLHWASPSQGDAIADGLASLVDNVPDDAVRAPPGRNHGGFSRLDQDVHQEHINATYEVARAAGRELTEDSTRLGEVVGACATDGDPGNDVACVDDFIRRFGARALRRPLEAEEVTMYREVFDANGLTEGMDPVAFADVIATMMIAPQFLYTIEHGDQPVPDLPGSYSLTGYELASRLSYHLWQTMPDDALFAAAQSGALQTEDGYAAQVDRMFDDPRTRASIAQFYRQWLWLDELPAMDALVGNPRFDAFAGDFSPGPDTHEHMVDETLAMLEYYTFDDDGSLADIMLTDGTFARHEDVAELYGTAVWSGNEPPPASPDGQRIGLLTRAALTASGTATTRPIMKGVFIRTALLCQSIPPPPDNAAAMPPAPDPGLSTREVVEQLTEQPSTTCVGCHATLINPLGFATENFDALGRFRQVQELFDDDGNRTGQRPIDTHSVPHVVLGDETPSEGPSDLAQQILDSGELHTCFARQYVRFSLGRPEDDQRDGCLLDDLTTRLDTSAPLAEVLRTIALRPEFQQRLFD